MCLDFAVHQQSSVFAESVVIIMMLQKLFTVYEECLISGKDINYFVDERISWFLNLGLLILYLN